jgi:hypothetical protein
VAAPTIVIDRTELNQQAMIATDDFPRIYWGKSRSHRVVGVPEPATPYKEPELIGGRFQLQGLICGTRPVEVKIKIHKAVNHGGENRNQAAETVQKPAKNMIDREAACCLLTVFLAML